MKRLASYFAVFALAVASIAYAQKKRAGGDLELGSPDISGQVRLKGNVLVEQTLLPANSLNAVIIDGGAIISGALLLKNSTQTPLTVQNGDGGTPNIWLEYGQATLSGGTYTRAFLHTFAVAPVCTCSDTASSAAACNASGATTTQMVLKGGASAVINWICVGDK